jgi:type IV pilus modification protein PilV
MARCYRGFTLIEVLAAVIIVAVTLLGVGALHLEAMTAGRRGLERLEALSLATALADTVRAFADAPVAASELFAGEGDATACAPRALCTADALIEQEVARWRAAVLANSGVPAAVAVDISPTPLLVRVDIGVPLPGQRHRILLEVLA